MVPTDIDDNSLKVAFSLTEGGPGFSVMKRLHLVHPELGTGAGRTAVALMSLTWGPLFFCACCKDQSFTV